MATAATGAIGSTVRTTDSLGLQREGILRQVRGDEIVVIDSRRSARPANEWVVRARLAAAPR